MLAALPRLWALGDLPPGLMDDEAVYGYDAWSIAKTGRDQYGVLLPIHFQSFNDYVPGGYQYLAAPFVGLFGPEIFAMRLPAALGGLAAVAWVMVLGWRIGGARLGLLAGSFLALSPWAVAYSRTAFPASLIPPLLTGAVALFLCGLRWAELGRHVRAHWAAEGAGALFALLLLTYPVTKLFMPLFGICLLLLYWPQLRAQPRLILAGAVPFLLIAAPLVYDNLVHAREVRIRFDSISVWNSVSLPESVPIVLGNYLAHFSPAALFRDGYVGTRPPGLPPWTGPVLPVLAIPIVLGIAAIARQDRRLALLLLAWLLLFPIPDSLLMEEVPDWSRSILLLPVPELLAAAGLVSLLPHLAPALRRVVGPVAVGLALLNAAPFGLAYFGGPPESTFGPRFRLGLLEALGWADTLRLPQETIWMESLEAGQSYIYPLVAARYDPARFQSARMRREVKGDWIDVEAFDGFAFSRSLPPADAAKRVLWVCQSCSGAPAGAEQARFLGWRVLVLEPGWHLETGPGAPPESLASQVQLTKFTNAPRESQSLAIAPGGQRYGLAWADARDPYDQPAIFFGSVDSSTGYKIGSEVRVSPFAVHADHPTVAWSGRRFGLAWEDRRHGLEELYFRALTHQGVAAGAEVRLTFAAEAERLHSTSPSLAWNGNSYALAYDRHAGSGKFAIFLQLLTEDGETVSPAYPLTDASSVSRRPSLVATGVGWAAAWQEGDGAETRVVQAEVNESGAVLSRAIIGPGHHPSLIQAGNGTATTWMTPSGRPAVSLRDGARIVASAEIPAAVASDNCAARSGWNGRELVVAWCEGRRSLVARLVPGASAPSSVEELRPAGLRGSPLWPIVSPDARLVGWSDQAWSWTDIVVGVLP